MECTPRQPGTFIGYRRPDGKVDVRNEVWIVPTVGFVNTVVWERERAASRLQHPISTACSPIIIPMAVHSWETTVLYVFSLASGEVRARSETFYKHEQAIFKDGVTL